MPKIPPRPPYSHPPTPSQPTERLDRNQQVTTQLAERYDTLNARYTQAEARLKALKPLRSAWVSYDHADDQEGVTTFDMLGLFKLDNQWRLVHAVDNSLNDGSLPFDIKPIVECSVETRIRAAKEVRQLHERIIEQKEKLIPEVEEAITELDSYCATD